MTLKRVERYTLAQTSQGIVIEMAQGWRSLGFSAICGAALAASWWWGPFGPHPARGFEGRFYWLLTGVLVTFVMLGVTGAFYRERWLITEHTIRQTSSFSTRSLEIPRTDPIRLQLSVARDNDGDLHPLPYRIDILNAQGDRTRFTFQFDRAGSVDQWISALRPVLSFAIDDRRRLA